MDRDLRLNGSGAVDKTAAEAIRKVDREKETSRFQQPQEVNRLIDIFKTTADLAGYEIDGRIALKNKKTRKVYK